MCGSNPVDFNRSARDVSLGKEFPCVANKSIVIISFGFFCTKVAMVVNNGSGKV